MEKTVSQRKASGFKAHDNGSWQSSFNGANQLEAYRFSKYTLKYMTKNKITKN